MTLGDAPTGPSKRVICLAPPSLLRGPQGQSMAGQNSSKRVIPSVTPGFVAPTDDQLHFPIDDLRMEKPMRIWSATGALTIAIITAAVGSSPLAQAASAPPAPAQTVQTYTGSETTTSPSPDIVPAIVCNLKVDNPHNSGHVAGKINVEATLSCKGLNPAYSSVTVQLYKIVCTPNCNAVAYGAAGSASGTYKQSITANSAGSCTPGQYYGAAYGYIQAPPGVNPPTGHLEAAGRTVSITC